MCRDASTGERHEVLRVGDELREAFGLCCERCIPLVELRITELATQVFTVRKARRVTQRAIAAFCSGHDNLGSVDAIARVGLRALELYPVR